MKVINEAIIKIPIHVNFWYKILKSLKEDQKRKKQDEREQLARERDPERRNHIERLKEEAVRRFSKGLSMDDQVMAHIRDD